MPSSPVLWQPVPARPLAPPPPVREGAQPGRYMKAGGTPLSWAAVPLSHRLDSSLWGSPMPSTAPQEVARSSSTGGLAPHSLAPLQPLARPSPAPLLSALWHLLPTGHTGPHLIMSAACSTDTLSTVVEFIRRIRSPGCSLPSAVLPAGDRHTVSHDSTTPADLLPPGMLTASSSSHLPPTCLSNRLWMAK